MTIKRLAFRYGFAIGLNEWLGCRRVPPETRLTTTAVLGALIAPFVVFVGPAARLYWLITGRYVRAPFGVLIPPRDVVVNPFRHHHPPEIRELMERPEHNWDPDPDGIACWYDTWVRVSQALYWVRPSGLRQQIRQRVRSTTSSAPRNAWRK
jgi:hypothetical protein